MESGLGTYLHNVTHLIHVHGLGVLVTGLEHTFPRGSLEIDTIFV